MTWGQLKERAEQVNVSDDAEIVLIDDADFRFGVANAEFNDVEFQLEMGDELDEDNT